MKKKMGMLLVAIGIFCLGCGGYLILQSIIEKNDGQKKTVVNEPVGFQEEYILDDSLRQAKVDFEDYVSSHLSHYHKLIEWKNGGINNSRYQDGEWHPDLVIELDLSTEHFPFAIECEWVSQSSGGEIVWAENSKLEACRKFADQNKMDVFVAIGVGGTARDPQDVYVLPISAAAATLNESVIQNYKRPDNVASLYYDVDNHSLY